MANTQTISGKTQSRKVSVKLPKAAKAAKTPEQASTQSASAA